MTSSPARTDHAASPAEVRTATPDDARAIVGGYDWLFAPPGAPAPYWDPDVAGHRLAAACDAAGSTVLVAERDGGLVGLATVYLDIVSVRYGQRAWLEDLAVHPDERSRGTGGVLLTRAMAWAAGCGATHLELDSGTGRVDAHRFYERHQPSRRSLCFSWDLVATP